MGAGIDGLGSGARAPERPLAGATGNRVFVRGLPGVAPLAVLVAVAGGAGITEAVLVEPFFFGSASPADFDAQHPMVNVSRK